MSQPLTLELEEKGDALGKSLWDVYSLTIIGYRVPRLDLQPITASHLDGMELSFSPVQNH